MHYVSTTIEAPTCVCVCVCGKAASLQVVILGFIMRTRDDGEKCNADAACVFVCVPGRVCVRVCVRVSCWGSARV